MLPCLPVNFPLFPTSFRFLLLPFSFQRIWFGGGGRGRFFGETQPFGQKPDHTFTPSHLLEKPNLKGVIYNPCVLSEKVGSHLYDHTFLLLLSALPVQSTLTSEFTPECGDWGNHHRRRGGTKVRLSIAKFEQIYTPPTDRRVGTTSNRAKLI